MSNPLKEGMRYTHLGLTMVVIVGLGLWGGTYADDYFGISPWGTLGGLGLGILFGGAWFILEIIRLMQSSGQRDEEP